MLSFSIRRRSFQTLLSLTTPTTTAALKNSPALTTIRSFAVGGYQARRHEQRGGGSRPNYKSRDEDDHYHRGERNQRKPYRWYDDKEKLSADLEPYKRLQIAQMEKLERSNSMEIPAFLGPDQPAEDFDWLYEDLKTLHRAAKQKNFIAFNDMIKFFRMEFTRVRPFPAEFRPYLVQSLKLWYKHAQNDDKELAKLIHNMYDLGVSLEVPEEKEFILRVMESFYRLEVISPEWAARFSKTIGSYRVLWETMDDPLKESFCGFLKYMAAKRTIYLRGARFTEILYDMQLMEVRWDDIPVETQEQLLNVIPAILHDFNRYEAIRLLIALGELRVHVKDYSKRIHDSVLLLYMGVVRLNEHYRFHRLGEILAVTHALHRMGFRKLDLPDKLQSLLLEGALKARDEQDDDNLNWGYFRFFLLLRGMGFRWRDFSPDLQKRVSFHISKLLEDSVDDDFKTVHRFLGGARRGHYDWFHSNMPVKDKVFDLITRFLNQPSSEENPPYRLIQVAKRALHAYSENHLSWYEDIPEENRRAILKVFYENMGVYRTGVHSDDLLFDFGSLGVRFESLPSWLQEYFEQYLVRFLNNAVVGTMKTAIRDFYRTKYDFQRNPQARSIVLEKIRQADAQRIFRKKIDFVNGIAAVYLVGLKWDDLPEDIQRIIFGVFRYNLQSFEFSEYDLGNILYTLKRMGMGFDQFPEDIRKGILGNIRDPTEVWGIRDLCRGLEFSGFFQTDFDEDAQSLVKTLVGGILQNEAKIRLPVVRTFSRANLSQWKPIYLSKILAHLYESMKTVEELSIEQLTPLFFVLHRMSGAYFGKDLSFSKLFIHVNKVLLEKTAGTLKSSDLSMYPEIGRYLDYLKTVLPPSISQQILSPIEDLSLPSSSPLVLPADHPARAEYREKLQQVAESLQQKYGHQWRVEENYYDKSSGLLVEPMTFAILEDEEVVGLVHLLEGQERDKDVFMQYIHVSKSVTIPLLQVAIDPQLQEDNESEMRRAEKLRKNKLYQFESDVVAFVGKRERIKSYGDYMET